MKLTLSKRRFLSFFITMIFILVFAGGCKNTPSLPEGYDYVVDDKGNFITAEDGKRVTQKITQTIPTDASGNPLPGYTEEPEESNTLTKPPEKFYIKVGFVFANDPDTDPAAESFKSSASELWRTLEIDSCYVKNVKVEQFDDAVEALKAAGANLIVSTSERFSNALRLKAEKDLESYSTTDNFIYYINFGSSTTSDNVASFQPYIYQAANVMGLLAAFNSDKNNIGVVADVNLENSHGVVNSFMVGVGEIYTENFQVNLNWALSEDIPATKNAIDDAIDKGADIIFLYQTSEAGIRYCEEKGVRVIGFSRNMSNLAPTTYLAGYYVNTDIFIVDTARSAQNGTYRGVLYQQGINMGAVCISYFSDLCKAGSAEICAQLQDVITKNYNPIFIGEMKDKNDAIRVPKGTSLAEKEILDVTWVYDKFNFVSNFSKPSDITILSDLTVYDDLYSY